MKALLHRARYTLAAYAIIALGVGLAWSAIATKSVTVDEFQALPHGLAVLATGHYEVDVGVPPLSKLLPALAVDADACTIDTSPFEDDRSSWIYGERFMRDNADDYHACFMRARIVSTLVLALCMGLALWLAHRLYGPRGALLTTACVALSPDLLAHGPLVTTDIYLATAVVGCVLAFDHLLLRPRWPATIALGVALGCACLCKLTGGLLYVLLPVALGLLWLWQRKHPDAATQVSRTTLRAVALAMLLGLLLIHAGYFFEGTLTPLRDLAFTHPAFQRLASALPWLPTPLPAAFVLGMDAQVAEIGTLSYLLGDIREGGFLGYYAVAALVKTPEPILLLLALATFIARPQRREVLLITIVLGAFGFFSLAGHKQIGWRYLLFVTVLAGVWCGRLVERLDRVPVAAVLAPATLALVLIAWRAHPHYIAYFNAVSGGSEHGHEILLDSNLDWGQDLIGLRQYMQRAGIAEVDLAYFGRVDPRVYGVHYRTLNRQRPERYVVISANFLYGLPYWLNGSRTWVAQPRVFAPYRTLQPTAVIGHTLYVYDLPNVRPKTDS